MENLDNLLPKAHSPKKNWENIQETCQTNSSAASKTTRDFLALVERNFLIKRQKPFEEFYPKKLGITPNGLYKNCGRIIKVSPSYCVQARLIFEARKIFDIDRKLQMREVADKLDMDEYHFSKLFKKHTGLTFTDYRKTIS